MEFEILKINNKTQTFFAFARNFHICLWNDQTQLLTLSCVFGTQHGTNIEMKTFRVFGVWLFMSIIDNRHRVHFP